ncbi:hypothetical protein LCGC14_0826920 [marine sediment metagenome]|uniref:Uncharacterized protein n=1 Tax=marine sediment metagenome TaxID=412755 RepID=A0A0F9Q2C8_9ZZZZ
MKKILILLMVLVCFASTAQATITYGQANYKKHIGALHAARGNDPLWNFIGEAEGIFNGTTTVPNVLFSPTATASAPTATEGSMYYDATTDTIKYRNASAWISLTGVGPGESGTLDDAYNSGFAIDVDGTAVTMTVSLGDNNAALIVNANDATNNANGIEVVVASSNTGAGLYVNGTTGTIDLLGDNFSMANTGILTMTSGDAIDNSTTDDIFQFTSDDKEDFSIDLSGTNIIGFSSDTSAITLEFNALDRLTGIEDITFDAEAATITLTGDADTEDLTISQAGTVDCSLILSSAGSITDALSLLTTDAVGVIKISSSDILDVDAVDHMNFDISGASSDFRVDSAAGSVYLEGAEAAADAIVIDASNAAGGIDMDCGSAGFDLTVTAGDLTLQNTTAKDIILDATAGRVLITGSESAADAIVLTADGANGEIAISAKVGGVDIDGVLGAVTINTTKNAGNAIHIEEDAGESGGINIFANQGVGASASTQHDASIQLHSDDGGIGLYSTANVGDTIRIETNGGVDENIFVSSVQGTGADSITLTSTLGGIAVTANAAGKDVVVSSVLGSISMKAEENAADAILLEVDGINSTTLRLLATTGTSVAEDGAAIQLSALVGGISIQSDANLDDAVTIRADGGTSAEITIHNDRGTTADSIELISDAGGIVLTASAPVVITNTSTFTGAATATAGLQSSAVTVTATADGLTTGLIPSGTSFVTVTSDTATKVVVLPAAVIGNIVWITVPATGCELQTLATTNATINTVDCDGTNELALVAGSIYRLVCTKAITWVATGTDSSGANEDSLAPDTD